jgi:hypothetical protein
LERLHTIGCRPRVLNVIVDIGSNNVNGSALAQSELVKGAFKYLFASYRSQAIRGVDLSIDKRLGGLLHTPPRFGGPGLTSKYHRIDLANGRKIACPGELPAEEFNSDWLFRNKPVDRNGN